MTSISPDPSITPQSNRRVTKKLLLLIPVLGLAAFAFVQFRDVLTLENLANQEAALRSAKTANPLIAFVVGFLIYVVVTALSLPGAAVLTLASGWFFGFWQGTLLVSFASTTGATLAFLFSRYLFRDSIQTKFGDSLSKFNDALEKEGPFYLFTLRLIPVVPFFVINLVMGLTPIRTQTFWWVSQLGMIAGTSVYVSAGAAVPTLKELAEQGASGILSPQVIVAFTILGLFPLVVKRIVAAIIEKRASDRSSSSI